MNDNFRVVTRRDNGGPPIEQPWLAGSPKWWILASVVSAIALLFYVGNDWRELNIFARIVGEPLPDIPTRPSNDN